jgi:replication factor C large subunit
LSLPWSERFKPKILQEIVGNYSSAEQLLNWVRARLEGEGIKKAALLSGPPGTGKTLSVGIVAGMLDLELIEMNASDFRTEELVDKMAGGATLQASLFGRRGKLVFFDELDGISGREDRGGLAAILKIIRETKYPVVLAVNDPWDPRFRSLREICEMIQFRRIRSPSAEVQLKRIARLANVLVDDALIKRVAERTGGDLRAAINDLQMLAEGRRSLRDGDVGLLPQRAQEKGIFDVMKGIFSAQGCLEAKLAVEGSSVDIEMVLQWINENIPNQYTNPEERAEAYDWFSKADIFMGRVKRGQMWDLMSYAIELATGGAALARRGPYRFTRYNFPRRIGMLSRSKEVRGRKREVLKAIGGEMHTSVKKVATEYLPYMEMMVENSKLPRDLLSWAEDSKET